MKVSGVTHLDLQAAAQEVDFTLLELRALNKAGTAFRFRLGLGPQGSVSRRYAATSASAFNRGRKTNGVCFHGHYRFFATLFSLCPNAVVQSRGPAGPITWRGRDDLRERAPAYGDTNVGPPISPIALRDCFECEKRDDFDV